jgi:hypothetical protein
MAIVEVHLVEDRAKIYSSTGAVYEICDDHFDQPTVKVLEMGGRGYERSQTQVERDDQLKRYRRALENIMYCEATMCADYVEEMKELARNALMRPR